MVLFTLTEIALDVSTAVLWWTLKNTYYGVKYTYNYFTTYDKNEQDPNNIILQIKNCDCVDHCSCF